MRLPGGALASRAGRRQLVCRLCFALGCHSLSPMARRACHNRSTVMRASASALSLSMVRLLLVVFPQVIADPYPGLGHGERNILGEAALTGGECSLWVGSWLAHSLLQSAVSGPARRR